MLSTQGGAQHTGRMLSIQELGSAPKGDAQHIQGLLSPAWGCSTPWEMLSPERSRVLSLEVLSTQGWVPGCF